MVDENATDLPYLGKIANILQKLRSAWNPELEEMQHLTGIANRTFGNDFEVSDFDPVDMNLARAANHPIHIVDEKNSISPSAFIPFCFWGKWNSIGTDVNQFSSPVCNSFLPKLRNDQICYEMDLNLLIKKENKKKEFKRGLYFIIDENKDRRTNNQRNGETLVYLDTIGNDLYLSILLSGFLYLLLLFQIP